MPAENKPCPFCGASLFLREDSTGAFYEHGDLPDAPGCVIATLCVEFDMLDQWNRRADTKECANLQAHNSESVKLPSETLLLSKCSFFETCPVSGKGHAGCYSEAPCFKR